MKCDNLILSKHLNFQFNFLTLYGVVKGEFKIEDWPVDGDICIYVDFEKYPKSLDINKCNYIELPYKNNLSDYKLAFYGKVFLQAFINNLYTGCKKLGFIDNE